MDERKPRDEKGGQTNEEDLVGTSADEEEFEDIEESDESDEEDLQE
jgi:hypothetical protein